MPLGDRPILSYTLDFLKLSGVQECFVFCTSFAQDIKDYLKQWTTDQGTNSMSISPITNESCRSFGSSSSHVFTIPESTNLRIFSQNFLNPS